MNRVRYAFQMLKDVPSLYFPRRHISDTRRWCW